MSTKVKFILLFAVILFGVFSSASALDWPVWPDSVSRPVSALYGTWFQNPGEFPKMHSGIDLAVPYGTPIYAMESGYVKAVITRMDHPWYWRVVIGDSAGAGETDAWMYAHVVQSTISATVGQWIEEGEYIGDVVDIFDLPHLHLSKIRYYGDSAHWADNESEWEFVGNPLDEIDIINDLDAPVLENAYGDQLLAFCQNDTAVYFGEGEPISGDVDIICLGYDNHNYSAYEWEGVPYSLEYRIDGDSSVPWTMSACFTGYFGTYDDMAEYTYVVFQDDPICNTHCAPLSYTTYFFNLTNTDGDTLVEPSDKDRCWQTSYFHNGEYKVFVRAKDKSNNVTLDSMMVTVENVYSVTGTIAYSDDNPDLAGTIVTVQPDDQYDTTDASGNFDLPAVGGGNQTVTLNRLGYVTVDTALLMIQDYDLEITMEKAPYLCGDADGGWTHNLLDATFIISYLYKEGPAPAPEEAADADGSGSVNLLDVTYLVNYLYKNGPEPIC